MCRFAPNLPILKNGSYKPLQIKYFGWIIDHFNCFYFITHGSYQILITQKQRYFVSMRPNKEFSVYSFKTASTNLCRTLSKDFIWSWKSYLVITTRSSIYTLTMLKTLDRSDIFYWNILGLLQNSKGSFQYQDFPQWSMIVQSYFLLVIF